MESYLLKQATLIREIMERDELILPNDYEREIVDFVLSYFKDNIPQEISTNPSTIEQEFKKSEQKMVAYFGDEVWQSANQELEDVTILFAKHFHCTFFQTYNKKQQTISRIPKILWIPNQMNQLSHIHLCHETIHLLKDSNLQEYLHFFEHVETIPILFTMIEAWNTKDEQDKQILHLILLDLSRTYQNIYGSPIQEIFSTHPQDYRYYELLGIPYFLAFYYAILLYKIYQGNPKQVLIEMKEVILKRKTTRQFLQHFEIPKTVQRKEFQNNYQKILKDLA